ncbi:MAG: AzlC family ABC transporter permease [Negativicoccus succinicivorans]|nr:AzlC family ABC transporter permease [Negativicoccus succinicivorans]
MNKHFRRGLAKGVPIAIGYMPIAIAYGVLSSVYGMPAWFVLASSAIVYAGSAQFMAANLMITGTGVWEIILTTLLVNSRNLLLAAGLAHNLEAGRRSRSVWRSVR